MPKYLKISLIILGSLIVLGYVAFQILRSNTKKHSPEQEITYKKNGVDFHVFYNSPSKKNRVIFGELVPYGKIWRTGANEPTTFTNSKSIFISGKELPAGKYSLWTIPNENKWEVIFNSHIPGWGINPSGSSTRKEEHDVVNVHIPTESLSTPLESFTIAFNDADSIFTLDLMWDKTKVAIPINFQ